MSKVGRQRRSLTKHERGEATKLLNVRRAVVVGWCALHRPNSDPARYECRWEANKLQSIWIALSDSEDDDAMIGPYQLDEAAEFAKYGIQILGAVAALSGRPLSERTIGGEWR
jgi:hypothetical protein